MIHLGILLIQYDQQRYAKALPTLVSILESLSHPSTLLCIDNHDESLPLETITSRHFRVGGDNRFHEFSGWEKGLCLLKQSDIFLKKGEGEVNLWLLVTDAFLAYGNSYQNLLNQKLVEWIVCQNAVAGIVDMAPASGPFQLKKWIFSGWIRSSFVLIPDTVIVQLGNLTTFETVDLFCNTVGFSSAFRADAPLSLAYQSYLIQWLTRDWHRAFELSNDTWPLFLQKIRSILNEHALTARLQELEVPLYDLYFLQKIQKQHKNFDSIDPLQFSQQKHLTQSSLPQRILKRLFQY